MVATNWLVIADQEKSITHPDCLDLAKLHSDAVDYQKTGRPVDLDSIPRPKHQRPDWCAPETIENIPNLQNKYYQSMTALGKLTRAIDLKAHEPSIPSRSRPRRGDRTGVGRLENLTDDLSSIDLGNTSTSAIFDAVEPLVAKYFNPHTRANTQIRDLVFHTFRSFSEDLGGISSRCSLSHRHFKPLSEEELIISTIAQKTSQPSFRKEKIAKLKEGTDYAFRKVKDAFDGDGGRPPKEYLKHAWAAWKFSIVETKKETFGSKAFWWISLSLVFDALKIVDEAEVLADFNARSQAGWPDESP